ncbi:hypothetical protein P0F65_19860 [Sphingomonas sp. I4]
MTAFFHTNKHKPDRPQYAGSRAVTLHPMTSDSLELIAAARRCAERAWRDGYAYTKAGILLDDLMAADDRPGRYSRPIRRSAIVSWLRSTR